MAVLLDAVRHTVAASRLIPAGGRIVAAISGGPDSVALAHALVTLQKRGERFEVVGLAHFNHQLRGRPADEDEEFCRAFAVNLGIPLHAGSADVRTLSRAEHRSIEDAARRARYAFLERTADSLSADRVAVGHTRDDQAETFLLKLIRGAGPRGLSAIAPRRGKFIRPLLDCSRADVLGYLAEQRLTFRLDETNDVLENPRNRIRHELIPYLDAHFSGQIVPVLAREAEIARLDAEYLDDRATESAASIVLEGRHGLELDAAGLLALPPALGRRVAHRALTRLAGDRFVGFAHVQALLQLACGGRDSGVDLPGQRAELRNGRILLTRWFPGRETDISEVERPHYALSVPGEVAMDRLGWTISARTAPGSDVPDRSRSDRVAVQAVGVATPLTVRTRRAGDAFRPLGLGGRKKLQDFFVDRKISRVDRDKVPLVVDAQDRIIWVVGQSISDDFRVTGHTEGVIILEARRSGGTG